MKFQIKKATKTQARLRMAIHGPSGAGKTFSALSIGKHLAPKVLLIDTERGSASKYADKFDFDVVEIEENYHPDSLIEIHREAPKQGYGLIITDSMTHFWNGQGGFLELVDAEVRRAAARGGKPDSFSAWKQIDPLYKKMVHALQACPAHVIVTLRAKTEYAREESNGKTKIRKLGMAPEIRDNFQYEMDVEGMLSIEHDLAIGKTRCDELDGKVFTKPGKDVADIVQRWLSDGAPAEEKPQRDQVEVLKENLERASSESERDTASAAISAVKDQLSKGDLTVLAEALKACNARLKSINGAPAQQ